MSLLTYIRERNAVRGVVSGVVYSSAPTFPFDSVQRIKKYVNSPLLTSTNTGGVGCLNYL